jgi:DNA-binding transcriptional ArsR family regulator
MMMGTATTVEQLMKPEGRSSMKKTKRVSVDVDEEVFERQVLICKAFANSTRLHILELLGGRDWAAGELQEELGISKANLSQHVTVMKTAGVIVRRRRGKQVYFSLAMPEVKQACHLIRSVLRNQVQNGKRFFT